MLKAYDILPLSVLGHTCKVDLSRFAILRGGVLHISRPQLEVWVPLSSLPYSAHATATSMSIMEDRLIRDTMTAKDYISCVFIPCNLPLNMSKYGLRPP